jgi:23S rRNA (guanosine2251-2'-O)-methyltransferase
MKPIKNNKANSNSYILYGKHAIFAALQNNKRIITKLITTTEKKQELLDFLSKNNLTKLYINKIEIKSNQDINSLFSNQDSKLHSSFPNHQGFILKCLPLIQPSLEDFLDTIKENTKSTIIILDQATDPNNIGAIIRTALGFGVDCIIKPQNNSPNETNSMVKMASGSFEKIPLISVINIKNTIDLLKKNNYWIYGLSSHSNTLSHKIQFENRSVFVLGSEDRGIRQLTAKNLDFLLKIPTSSELESLNLSIASSIILYENYKQKSIL